MTLRNSTVSYGSLAKFLHWFVALFFLAAYCAVYYRRWFTEECPPAGFPSACSPENLVAFGLHKSFGMSIAAFVLLRIIWRLSNPKPKPEPASKLEHLGASLGHGALYFFMIVMPLTGWMGSGGPTDVFGAFEVPAVNASWLYDLIVTQGLGIDFKTFEAPIDFIHKEIGGARLVWILILIHVSAALYHHFYKKDQTLVRMLPARLFKGSPPP
jgi:cytochrome b561